MNRGATVDLVLSARKAALPRHAHGLEEVAKGLRAMGPLPDLVAKAEAIIADIKALIEPGDTGADLAKLAEDVVADIAPVVVAASKSRKSSTL